MKWFKRAILAVVLIALFVISAMIAVVILVDPNDYKDQITEAASQATGRNLRIDGEIGLSVFPWLGLELNQVSLDNRPDFTQERFAEMQRLNIKVALLPLLSLTLKVGEIQLKGLQVNLERRIDGANNWDDLLSGSDSKDKTDVSASDGESQAGGSSTVALRDFYIGGLNIEDARISWRDNKEDTSTQIEYFNLKTGAIRSGETSSFDMRFACRNETPKVIAGVETSGRIGFDLAAQRYTLTDLRLNLKASGTVIPGNDHEINLEINELIADLHRQTLDIDRLGIASEEFELTLKLAGKNILADTLTVEGDIALDVPSLRALMMNIGEPVPPTTDDSVLAGLRLTSQFKGDLDKLELQSLKLNLDDSAIQGNVAVQNFSTPAYRFELNLDQIDLDRYMPPPVLSDDDNPESDVVINTPVGVIEPELPVPVDTLRELNADGKLTIGSVKIMNLHLADIETVLNAGNGKVALKPLNTRLYDGRFDGDLSLDVTEEKPVYSTHLDLVNLQSGSLLQDYMGKRLLEGRMNVQGELDTAGTRISEFKQNLNGILDLAFKDGALSTDVRQRLRDRKAEIKQKFTGETVNTSTPVGEPTKFSSITAKANISNGIVSNNDLEVRARHMYVTGKGIFELPDNYIDYVLTILLSHDDAGQDDPLDDLVDFPIEYHLQGKLDELDYAKITRDALVDAARSKLKQGIDKEKEAARAELERKKQAAKAQLDKQKAELAEQKRLAAEKEKASLERQKKEAEQRAKEKLENKKEKLLDRLLN